MLDETNQIKLSITIPVGMTDLPVQLQIRSTIKKQQQELEELHVIPVRREEYDDETLLVEQILQDLGINRYGIAPILTEYCYENAQIHPDEKLVIVIPMAMDYDAILTAPSYESAIELYGSYQRVGEKVVAVTKKLREAGIQATGHHPMGDINEYHHLLFPPHAVEAGLGERGRTGLFIDYVMGPLVRLGMVSIALNIELSTKQPRGITEFCHRCRYCVDYCPPKALPDGKYLDEFVTGKPMEFKINAQRCFKYFEKHQGCGKCIVHCILAHPDPQKIKQRLERITAWYDKWIVTGELEAMYKRELANSKP